MAMINSLEAIDKIEQYSDMLEKILEVEDKNKCSNELSKICVQQLPILEECKNKIKKSPHMKFMTMGGESTSLFGKFKEGFNSFMTDLPYMPEKDIARIERRLNTINKTRDRYTNAVNKHVKTCDILSKTGKYPQEKLETAKNLFNDIANNLDNLTLPEVLQTVKEKRDQALDIQGFSDVAQLSWVFLEMSLLRKTTELALKSIEKTKEVLIRDSNIIIHQVTEQIESVKAPKNTSSINDQIIDFSVNAEVLTKQFEEKKPKRLKK